MICTVQFKVDFGIYNPTEAEVCEVAENALNSLNLVPNSIIVIEMKDPNA